VTTIKNRFKVLFCAVTVGFVGPSDGQTAQRTSNGLVVKSTAKVSPPPAALSRAGSQAIDGKTLRAKQEREAAQLAVQFHRKTSSVELSRKLPNRSASIQRGTDGSTK
jgi:hypothetical protein